MRGERTVMEMRIGGERERGVGVGDAGHRRPSVSLSMRAECQECGREGI